MKIILTAVFAVMVLFMAAAFIYSALGWFKWLYHDRLGWHLPDFDKGKTFDACNIYASCRHCGKEITQDSQGNWFLSGGE